MAVQLPILLHQNAVDVIGSFSFLTLLNFNCHVVVDCSDYISSAAHSHPLVIYIAVELWSLLKLTILKVAKNDGFAIIRSESTSSVRLL